MEKGKFIVISGPSGVGKGTICNELVKRNNAWLSVSMTTREMREGEEDGKSYYFITKAEFEQRIKEGKLLEYNIYNDNYYGTPLDKVIEKLEEGKNVILEIDVNGGHQVKKIYPETILVYIAPPSTEELKRRLHERGTEDEETIEKRLAIAEIEKTQIDDYDYIIVNDILEDALNEVNKILKEN